jgi:hypothetical protein
MSMTPQELKDQLTEDCKYFITITEENNIYMINFRMEVNAQLGISPEYVNMFHREYMSSLIRSVEREIQTTLIETAGYRVDHELQDTILRHLSHGPSWYASHELSNTLSKALVFVPLENKD